MRRWIASLRVARYEVRSLRLSLVVVCVIGAAVSAGMCVDLLLRSHYFAVYGYQPTLADYAAFVMTFGPISVSPDSQHQGHSRILLQHSMEKAKELGAGALAITGDGDFYGKSGFVVASTKGIHYYAEPREEAVPYFLIKELEDGFLDGVTGTYADPDGYDCEGVDIDAFDAQFPPKEKMRLPGQLA